MCVVSVYVEHACVRPDLSRLHILLDLIADLNILIHFFNFSFSGELEKKNTSFNMSGKKTCMLLVM